MENYVKIKLRPSTFKTSQGFLKNHIKPQIGSIPLAELTSLDLQRLAILQAPAGRRPGRPRRGQEKAERVSTENRAKHPSDDWLGVQPRHAAHRAAHNKGAILYRRE